MGLLAHQATNGDPCTTVCQYFDCGRCPHYQRLRKVPSNFDSEILQSIPAHEGLCSVMMQISSSNGMPLRILPFVIHLLTAKDVLKIRKTSEVWDELKRRYPAGRQIDIEKLTEDVKQKLKEYGLL